MARAPKQSRCGRIAAGHLEGGAAAASGGMSSPAAPTVHESVQEERLEGRSQHDDAAEESILNEHPATLTFDGDGAAGRVPPDEEDVTGLDRPGT